MGVKAYWVVLGELLGFLCMPLFKFGFGMLENDAGEVIRQLDVLAPSFSCEPHGSGGAGPHGGCRGGPPGRGGEQLP